MFWRSTLEEVSAVFEQDDEKERAAILRAGLITSAILNVHRAQGASLVRPSDFLPDTEEDWMSPEEAETFMDQWAGRQNGAHGG